MRYLRKSRIVKPIALILVFSLVLQIGLPLRSYALTSGPSQPEFSSFEPVSTVKMVDEFTGDLTYNLPVIEIPGPEGSSYPLSLSYHGGASPEEDASWVGYGWTLNPGAIMRGKAGYPDDFNGEEVMEYNRVPANWTVGLGPTLGMELFSQDLLSMNASIRYNNYKGFGYTAGIGVTKQGLGTLGYSVSDGEGSFSMQINVGRTLGYHKAKKDYEAVMAEVSLETNKQKKRALFDRLTQASQSGKSSYGFSIPGREIRPSSVTPYIGNSFNIALNYELDPLPIPIGLEVGLQGSFSIQKNIEKDPLNAFGYLYSHNADTGRSAMDYYTERLIPYEAHDRHLGIPFSSPDAFSATGEAVSGGFRLHSKATGTFHPNKAVSETSIEQINLELTGGPLTFGLGGDVGVGSNILTVGKYKDDGYAFSNAGDEPYFFRFTGDKGGTMNVGGHAPAKAWWDPILGLNMPGAAVPRELNDGNRVQRSSHIGFNTNAEMFETMPGNIGKATKAYTRTSSLINSSALDRANCPQGIGEFAITNSHGAQNIYGLPVYSRNENDLSYLLRRVDGGSVDQNYKVYGSYDKESARYVVGRETKARYASQYLLTEILQPDYLDRTMNGPTEDDFGGWTTFSYTKLYGNGANDWYKWRMPYNGLQYNRNELSDNEDDIGSVHYGEKEVHYLERVDTRTHYAKFILGDRMDAYDAEHNEAVASASNTSHGLGTLKRLDAIELWRKNPAGADELIKTVHFQYDYSAWQACSGLPNSNAGAGKLTLRRVWFDYQGIVNARISPYEFFYEYPRTISGAPAYPAPAFPAQTCPNYNLPDGPGKYVLVDYPEKYNDLENYGYFLNETPKYDPRDLDPWGCYQMGGADRYANFQTWENQVPQKPVPAAGTIGFDPAAYQLKTIRFPSGGQIHVQYEQDEYSHVQDRNPMAMVRVSKDPNDVHSYFLETVDDLGIPLADARTQEIKQMMYDQFVAGQEKIYFKFLYSLFPLSGIPELSDCDAEYIDGYVNLTSVHIPNTGGGKIKVTVGNNGGSTYKYPESVCDDLLKTSKAGKIKFGMDCSASQGALENNTTASALFHELAAWIVSGAGNGGCGAINEEHSYLRIPIPTKKGGGLRVKRILMYDNGLELNGAGRVLYGTEYKYETIDGKCSGVATKEPSASRLEDPLVNILDRYDQHLIGRIISGKDKTQTEGPLGESLLPQASVGYGRIVSQSIHSGRTSPGYAVSQFYTCKDYPYDKRYATIDNQNSFLATPMEKHRIWVPEIAGLLPISFGIDNRYLTQGYRFILFDIAGQPKSMESFAGTYDAGTQTTNGTSVKLISGQYMNYFEPGDPLDIMNDVDEIVPNAWYPGKEMEVVCESRRTEEIALNARFEQDASVCLLLGIPVPIFGIGVNLSYSEHKLKSHVTSKVERYPAIQKSLMSFQDGIWHKTENLAFNPETGSPVLSRTTDGYDGLMDLQESQPGPHDGSYHAYAIPASRHYTDLGRKSTNERMALPMANSGIVINKLIVGGRTYLNVNSINNVPNPSICTTLASLSAGSRVALTGAAGVNGYSEVYICGESNGSTVELLPSTFYPHNTAQAVNIGVLILKSGKKNRLEEGLGGFTTYGPKGAPTPPSSNTALNTTRDANYVVPLNQVLQSINSGATTGDVALGVCELKAIESNDGGIRLTKIGSGVNSYLQIEVIDWRTTANIQRCVDVIPNFAGGHFALDVPSGEIVFFADDNPCKPYKLPCLEFCLSNPQVQTMPDVVVASANTYSDNWPYEFSFFGQPQAGSNVYETGEKGQWRPLSAYSYRTGIVGGAKDDLANGNERTYKKAGVFPLNLFNYADPTSNDPTKWLKTTTVTQYTPFGMAMEEQNILGIFSNAHYGYNQTVPLLSAQNGNYGECYFESFEMTYLIGNQHCLEERVPVNNALVGPTQAHAGRKSYKLTNEFVMKPFVFDLGTYHNGFSMMAWVYDESAGTQSILGEFRSGNVVFPANFEWEARSGYWNLYEVRIKPNTIWGILPNQYIVAGDTVTPVIMHNPVESSELYLDDVRYQPLDAKMGCFVYDVGTLRPVCTFDDQHFGVYNQYNAEGKLMRKLIETERGMRTVQETQYHSPNQIRTQ